MTRRPERIKKVKVESDLPKTLWQPLKSREWQQVFKRIDAYKVVATLGKK